MKSTLLFPAWSEEYVFLLPIKYRCSLPEAFCKKGVLENFAKFTEKHRSLFFNKVADLRPAIYQKRDSNKGVFL